MSLDLPIFSHSWIDPFSQHLLDSSHPKKAPYKPTPGILDKIGKE
jgi:hypothetical protein